MKFHTPLKHVKEMTKCNKKVGEGDYRACFHCTTLTNTSNSPHLTILVHSLFWTKEDSIL